jgi:hypothetical protein
MIPKGVVAAIIFDGSGNNGWRRWLPFVFGHAWFCVKKLCQKEL